MIKQRINRALSEDMIVHLIFSKDDQLTVTEIVEEIDLPNWIAFTSGKSSKIHYVNLDHVHSIDFSNKNLKNG